MTWLEGPLGFVVVILAFFAIASLGMPSYRRQQLKLAEIKASSGDEYKELNTKYEQLAAETREVQTSMKADLSAIRASVEAIEQMMRDVG